MPQPLLNDFWMNSRSQHQTGLSVTQVVKNERIRYPCCVSNLVPHSAVKVTLPKKPALCVRKHPVLFRLTWSVSFVNRFLESVLNRLSPDRLQSHHAPA